MSVLKYLTSLGHKVYVKDGLLYDSTGKQVYKDNGRYYVKSNKGNRLYFKEDGQFELVNQEKGFLEKVKDKILSVSQEIGKVNPLGARAFIPQGSLKIVELSLVANGVPVRTSDGSFKTYSKEEQETAKKLLDILGTVAVATPVIVGATPVALKTIGLAITPSTWIGGAMQAAGYLIPSWFLNGADLLASAYFVNEAANDVKENGLNWQTATNALLSLSPFTRDANAIEGVAYGFNKIPKQTINSAIKSFKAARNALSSPKTRLGRELNENILNTQFINVPIEHVSTKGITEGAGLNSYSSSDVGFHFSPAGSLTTYNILKATNAPFVRTGTWTYTNNTKPVFVFDKGNWRYSYNPEIYDGVNPGNTIAENAMALNLKGPNFTYVNNYEGHQREISHMTTEPNSNIVLSKNVQAKVLSEKLRTKPKDNFVLDIESLDNYLLGFLNDDGMYKGDIGDSTYLIFPRTDKGFGVSILKPGEETLRKTFDNFDSLKKFIEEQHEKYLSTLSPLLKTVYLERPVSHKGKREGNVAGSSAQFRRDIKNQIRKDINEFYMSPEYKERFLSKRGGAVFYPELKQSLLEVAENTHPSSFIGENWQLGHSLESDSRYNTLGINTNLSRSEFDLENTITHEFGHGMYRPWLVETDRPLYFIMINNDNLTLDALDNLNPGVPVDEFTKYISKSNELRQRIIPYVKRSFEEGLTPEETYDIITDKDLKETFKKDYIIKLIGGMLGTVPIITNNDRES